MLFQLNIQWFQSLNDWPKFFKFTFGIHLKVSKANELILNCTFFLFFFNICFLKTREVMIWSQSNIQPVLCQAGTSPLMDGLIHVRTSLTLEIRKGKFFVLRGYQHFSANPFCIIPQQRHSIRYTKSLHDTRPDLRGDKLLCQNIHLKTDFWHPVQFI